MSPKIFPASPNIPEGLSSTSLYCVVWIQHILFMHSSADGHLGRFYLWLLQIMLPLTCRYKFLCEHGYSFLLDIRTGQELPSHTVTLCLRNCQTFPKWLHHFTFPPAGQEGSSFTISSPTITFTWLFCLAVLVDVKWYPTVALICCQLFVNKMLLDGSHANSDTLSIAAFALQLERWVQQTARPAKYKMSDIWSFTGNVFWPLLNDFSPRCITITCVQLFLFFQ